MNAGGAGGFPDCGQEAHLHTTHNRAKDVGTSSHLVVLPYAGSDGPGVVCDVVGSLFLMQNNSLK